jgi:hypothetical protein
MRLLPLSSPFCLVLTACKKNPQAGIAATPAVAPSHPSGKHLEESKRAAVGDVKEVANLRKDRFLAIVNRATS